MTKNKPGLPEKLHSRRKGNIEVEYFKQGKKYSFIVYAFDGDNVKDQEPSQLYSSLVDCLYSGIIQFYNIMQIHGK